MTTTALQHLCLHNTGEKVLGYSEVTEVGGGTVGQNQGTTAAGKSLDKWRA